MAKKFMAMMFRHGHGLDLGDVPRDTREEAENDLRVNLSDMVNKSSREQAEAESYVCEEVYDDTLTYPCRVCGCDFQSAELLAHCNRICDGCYADG